MSKITVSDFEKIYKIKEQGVLTESEFEQKKREFLGNKKNISLFIGNAWSKSVSSIKKFLDECRLILRAVFYFCLFYILIVFFVLCFG